MRCESYNANKFNIMFHVCSLVVMSESPLNLKLQQERIKTCNSKPNSFFKKLFKGSWRCPAFLKNQSGKLPEPSNSPINWKQMKNLSKPNASQKKVLWREMKGIWEKEGKTWKLFKKLFYPKEGVSYNSSRHDQPPQNNFGNYFEVGGRGGIV